MNIEQFEVKGEDFIRNIWFAAGPVETRHPLAVFLDGEHYLKSMDVLSILDTEITSGRIPPMSIVLVSHHGNQARHEDYICNDRFARFVAKDIVAFARSRVDAIRGENNVICGVSLSGLASAHATLMFPDVFSSSLGQSGSFWWSHQRFATLASQHSTTGLRFWLSVGDKEIDENVSHPPTGMYQGVSQLVGVQSAVDALKAGGAEVRHHVFNGGHEFGSWNEELGDALQWLMGGARK
jgi:iron(III)-enterobactin esterase